MLPTTCQIVAVSKLQSTQQILRLVSTGQRHFAENYVQEALPKIAEITADPAVPPLTWHFIGKLQKNKVKDIVGKFAYIHSVDSFAVAEKINSEAQKKSIQQKIFLQVNLANEASKAGCQKQDLPGLLEQISTLSSVAVIGLMTMPPPTTEAELSRPFFRELKRLLTTFSQKYPQLTELSMGTSADYLIAVSEGATFIRLGTILFGARNKK